MAEFHADSLKLIHRSSMAKSRITYSVASLLHLHASPQTVFRLQPLSTMRAKLEDIPKDSMLAGPGPASSLDGTNVVFGKVLQGMDTVARVTGKSKNPSPASIRGKQGT